MTDLELDLALHKRGLISATKAEITELVCNISELVEAEISDRLEFVEMLQTAKECRSWVGVDKVMGDLLVSVGELKKQVLAGLS